jgi:hypothetical protein
VVYLMRQVGPGATAANEVVAPVSVSGLSASYTPRTLFSGLTLAPVNYYLVLVSTNSGIFAESMATAIPSAVTVTPGGGVTDLGQGRTIVPPAGFPPATAVVLSTPGEVSVTVTGDLTVLPATPAPSSLILLLTGLAEVALFAARRKFARAS